MISAPCIAVDFISEVFPILKKHCIRCHGGQKQEGGLRLDQRASAMKGGDYYAPAIIPRSSDTSPLWAFVSRDDADLQMPPEGPRLNEVELQQVKEWIDDGASWPESSAELSAQSTHWSFQPLRRPAVPGSGAEQPIDAFIRAEQSKHELTLNSPADRRTLIRRLSFDLLGLPPEPPEVAAFETDPDPLAWNKLVERYLDSPRFGERAARYWLDVVRFAESDGFETNQPRPNAWRYRDYVIDSFNHDLPYDQFVREQLAGDQLDAGAATGFLVGGAWDRVKSPDPVLTAQQRADELHDMISTTGSAFLGLTVGCSRCHSHKFDPIPQSDYYALKATFEGVMHGEREIEAPSSPDKEQLVYQRRLSIAGMERELKQYEPRASLRRTQIISPLDPEKTITWHTTPSPAIASGTRRGAAQDSGTEKLWPNLSTGYLYWKLPPRVDACGWKPNLSGTFRLWVSWGCGYRTHTTDAVYLLDRDGDLATRDDQHEIKRVDQQRFADGADDIPDQPLWSGLLNAGVLELDHESLLILRQGDQDSFVTSDLVVLQQLTDSTVIESRPALRLPVSRDLNRDCFSPVMAKYVRMTVLATSDDEPCIDEIEVMTTESESRNIALASHGTRVTASGTYPNNEFHKLEHVHDSQYGNSRSWISNEFGHGWVQFEFPDTCEIDEVRWSRDRGSPPQYADRIATMYRIETSLDGQTWTIVATHDDRLPLGTIVPGGRLDHLDQGSDWQRLNELRTEHATATSELLRLTEKPRAYAGQFVTPGPTYRLNRGDVTQPKEPVGPGSLSEIGTPIILPPNTPEAARRLALANWLVNLDNPLTARVIVNRLWLQHFGEGIVDTPSDLGANGGRPSHPELLDWLASELREPTSPGVPAWSLKHIHRLICQSKTYQQSSASNEHSLTTDAESRLLWRYPPRRLEAEAIRDAILAVSGQLRLHPGGPGFDLFEPNTNYVKVYNSKRSFEQNDFRRMIYQSKPRMQLEDTFGTFDCPDAGQVTPKRTSSTTALQALSLLNSPFLLEQSQAFAQRIKTEAPGSITEQVERAFLLAFGRYPTAQERQAGITLVNEHQLVALCRALFNTHEFMSLR